MRTIASSIDHEMTWTQRKGLRSEFELKFGDDLVAVLRFPKVLGSAAVAESGDGSWTFERLGVLKPNIVVHAVGSSEELGTYIPKAWSGGGTLQLSDGRKAFLSTNAWKRTLRLESDTGETMMELKGRGFFRFSMDVVMFRVGARYPEFPWMMMLVAYRAVMMRREAAAHSAAH